MTQATIVDRVNYLLYLEPMGLTYVHARLRKVDGRGPARDVRFLVDSGAIYSVLPKKIWRALRLKPARQVEFTLADGTSITRGVSECRFEIRGESATSPVVLGDEHDGALVGAVTLETLGLMLHPLTREVLPMRVSLSHLDGKRSLILVFPAPWLPPKVCWSRHPEAKKAILHQVPQYRFTEYFEHEVLRKRLYLRKEWCIHVLEKPLRSELQEGKPVSVLGRSRGI